MDIVIIVVGILLIGFALWQTIQKFRGKAKSSCCGTAEAVSVKKVEDTDVSHYPYRYRLSVDGMHCSNCAKNVENQLNGISGVWAKVDLGKKTADVLTKSPVDEESFRKVLQEKSYSLTSCQLVSEAGKA